MGKVFCIGMYKTGTTSVGKALERLGFRTFHGSSPYLRLPIDSFAWDRQHYAQFHQRVANLVDLYDAFEDFPFMWIYREMEESFPDAKFILTERDPIKVAESDINMWKQLGRRQIPDRQKFIDRYINHHNDVINHFGESDKLLRIHLGDGAEWQEICDFLELPEPEGQPFPRAHRRPYGRVGGVLFKTGRILKDLVRDR